MLNHLAESLYTAASDLNKRHILDLVSDRSYSTICDLGCDDGLWTTRVAAAARSSDVFGIEVVPAQAAAAEQRGVHVKVSDLETTFPFPDESFDLVHANQVIEHMKDLDHFLSESHRVLKPDGTAIISTENGSSWHNIFAALMGWQIFSLTNVSVHASGLGNPLAIHRGPTGAAPSWTHKTVFNYRGLIEILDLHGLRVTRVLGAGYHPLPPQVGQMDARHSHFLAVRARRRQ